MRAGRRWTRPLERIVVLTAVAVSAWAAPSLVGESSREQAAGASGVGAIRLNEIGRASPPAGTAFIELVNTGAREVRVNRLALRFGENTLLFRRLLEPVAPGGLLVVRFDGQGTAEGQTLHAGAGVDLPVSGRIELLDDEDQTLDVVTWGDEVSAGRANWPSRRRAVTIGSIGRAPGANESSDSSAWVSYQPGAMTPGASNPMPPVEDMSPADGAVLAPGLVTLTWMPVAGATAYRVQVATDVAFGSVMTEKTVTEPELALPALPVRAYFWRVQATGAGTVRATYSEPQTFEVAASGGLPAFAPTPRSRDVVLRVAARAGSAQSASRDLGVRMVTQHKDSPLLLLESNQQRGQHAWDKDHQVPSRIDKADMFNCALANAAMVNHFYQGDLTQDRIGVEVLGKNSSLYASLLQGALVRDTLAQFPDVLREVRPGPEADMPWGKGIDGIRLTAALLFALGREPDVVDDFSSWDEFFGEVIGEIDDGRPVVVANTHHTFTITGYSTNGTRQRVFINDPANGRYSQDLSRARFRPSDMTIWKLKAGSRGRRQEPSVTADSDSDGVTDFDEVERFRTNPQSPDSDRDGVKDKEDIASGVFEIEHGYGYAMGQPGRTRGRDYDRDGEPTERDADADNGGCKDGDEDIDFNGMHGGNETGNFDETDDICTGLQGSITFIESYIQDEGGTLEMGTQRSVTVMVKLRPDRDLGPGHFADGGSTYSFQSVGHLTLRLGPDCISYARAVAHAGGLFRGEGFEIGATIGEGTGTLALGAGGSAMAQVTTEMCGPLGSATGTIETTLGLPDCEGREARPGSRDFIFNCTTPPTPPAGGRFLRWTVRGRVKLN